MVVWKNIWSSATYFQWITYVSNEEIRLFLFYNL